MEQGTIATGLYTKEQQDYVDSVKDEHLRSHLLHQVRLRDSMEADRNGFEKLMAKSQLKEKIIIDLEDLRNDKSEGSYYYSWQANIAMSFYDAFKNKYPYQELYRNGDIHEISNQAAKNFLDLLCSKPQSEDTNVNQ